MEIPWQSEHPPKPTLSWLAYGRYEECPRKWFYSYMLEDYKGDDLWHLKQQKNLMPWGTLPGRVVDDLVTATLRHFRRTGNAPVNIASKASNRIKDYVDFSRRWTESVHLGKPWPRDQILQPLDRIFFCEDPTIEEIEEAQTFIEACLKNFEDSDFYRGFRESPPDQMVFTRDNPDYIWPWLDDRGVPVYISFDLAYRRGETWWIVDWKTGNPQKSLERTLEQLHWYAALLVLHWGISPDKIRLVAGYLASPAELSEHAVNEDRLEGIRRAWRVRHRDLAERMAKISPLIQYFPTTIHKHLCSACLYRSCPQYRVAHPGCRG